MSYMDWPGSRPYNRRQARREAKAAALKALCGEKKRMLFGAALAAILPSLLLTAVVEWQSMQEMMASYAVSMQESTLMTATAGTSDSLASLLVWVLRIFALIPLNIGLYAVLSDAVRVGRYPVLQQLFVCFQSRKRYWLSVKLAVLVTVYSIAWLIPVTAVCIAPFLAVTRAGTLYTVGGMVCLIAGCVLTFFMLLFYAAKIQIYSASYLLSLDHEEKKARQLFAGTQILYRGRLSEVMVFLLSFIGWYIPPIGALISMALWAINILFYSVMPSTGSVILIVACLLLMTLYCIWISAYQTMAFLKLTTQLQVRCGDSRVMTYNEAKAYEEWKAYQIEKEKGRNNHSE